MKTHLLASLILATLTSSAFALPGDEQPPLIERQPVHHQSTVAEGGADRLIDSRDVAENGSERTKGIRVAEGGSDRLIESRDVAENGSERTKGIRVAEGGSDRLIDSRDVAENGSERVGRHTA
ncbi:hypothetical protein ACF8C6_10625 [Pseudomonas sp. zbq_18]|uniref:hypothetical protein n=1 Tax=Pseudomonas sp. zbq_18 TaxID=3367251 RepID=UPI00370B7949